MLVAVLVPQVNPVTVTDDIVNVSPVGAVTTTCGLLNSEAPVAFTEPVSVSVYVVLTEAAVGFPAATRARTGLVAVTLTVDVADFVEAASAVSLRVATVLSV